jgi:response regulator of citrate/malate metabolism
MSERLDQIEAILLENTRQMASLFEAQTRTQQQIDGLREAQARNQEQIEANTAAIADTNRELRASIEDLVNVGTTTFELASENAIFIRGLQVENRRILRELRDQRRGNA